MPAKAQLNVTRFDPKENGDVQVSLTLPEDAIVLPPMAPLCAIEDTELAEALEELRTSAAEVAVINANIQKYENTSSLLRKELELSNQRQAEAKEKLGKYLASSLKGPENEDTP